MKLKHTPGPWKVDTVGGTTLKNEKDFHVVRKDNEILISTWGKPHLANARLIAAAPDMLEALIKTYKHNIVCGRESEIIDFMKSIIESATGLSIYEVLK